MKQSFLLPEFFGEETVLPKAVNVASVPQRSLFRYPGGKTWFVPCFRRWIKTLAAKPRCLVEPFAGGGIISLTALFENLVDRVLMVELDEQVAAVWQAIVDGDSEWLAKRIIEFDITRESVLAEIQTLRHSTRELAFQTILRNRTLHGGILAEGSRFVNYGENGKGIRSRWYPQTLAARLRNLSFVRSRIDFLRVDGLEVLSENADRSDAIFFIDPPYTAGGKRAGHRLYRCFELDHERLFQICESLRGDFLMTYDNAEEVKAMARKHRFDMKLVPMKNTHHAEMTELLIGRNLDWLEETPSLRETSHPYRVRKRSGHDHKTPA